MAPGNTVGVPDQRDPRPEVAPVELPPLQLTSLDVIVRLIGATTTTTGLTVRAALDRGIYPAGFKVRDNELAAVRLVSGAFHGERNYRIWPSRKAEQLFRASRYHYSVRGADHSPRQ